MTHTTTRLRYFSRPGDEYPVIRYGLDESQRKAMRKTVDELKAKRIRYWYHRRNESGEWEPIV